MCVSVSGEIQQPVLLTLASLVLLLVLYYGVECVSDDACSLFGLCSQSSISGSCVPERKTNINANLVAINAFLKASNQHCTVIKDVRWGVVI